VWIDLPVSRLTFPMHDIAYGNKVFASKAPILVLLYHGTSFVKLMGCFAAHCARCFSCPQNAFKQ
jgi:hypothetical protein